MWREVRETLTYDFAPPYRRLPNIPTEGTTVKKFYLRTLRYMDDAVWMKRFNGWAAIFFAVLIIPSIFFGWVEQTTFVSVLSIWALVAAHWSTWQAARVEEFEKRVSRPNKKPIRVAHTFKKRYNRKRTPL